MGYLHGTKRGPRSNNLSFFVLGIPVREAPPAHLWANKQVAILSCTPTAFPLPQKRQGERNQTSPNNVGLNLRPAPPRVLATDHIVGANKGWNPGINYTLWANNQTFYVGDLISFRYQKTQYNVFEVNQTGYDSCTTEGAVGNWSSGKDFIPLNESKRYYFICGNGQCFNGMKVSVVVHPLPSPTASPAASHSSNSSNAAGLVILPRGITGFRTLVVALASIWFGSGWV
ncbi:hypothetical protein ES319_D05G121800v1 [Gossypium barbadense]|uniref:Phytocyanin domain-containing protein n=2 Tax=Gossypium TaxID=3633 RepID=A0A5J5RCK4_GOSBA|nr:hypothetical protein ES319_D05G121800v1 [Gossypium barbadense]TYG68109.1 hypothetical protein ES288_D05G127400v1 [Gossypium darwinii]